MHSLNFSCSLNSFVFIVDRDRLVVKINFISKTHIYQKISHRSIRWCIHGSRFFPHELKEKSSLGNHLSYCILFAVEIKWISIRWMPYCTICSIDHICILIRLYWDICWKIKSFDFTTHTLTFISLFTAHYLSAIKCLNISFCFRFYRCFILTMTVEMVRKTT